MKNIQPKIEIEPYWEKDLQMRYPKDIDKPVAEFRNYDEPARDTVKSFYELNHTNQTYDFVLKKEEEFLSLDRKKMSLWEAVDYLNTLVDDSDPDIDLDQTQHLLQTAEALRAHGHPEWLILTGFLHDLGKILCLFGEPQWAVVGDTFPVGCKFSDKIVYSEYFKKNPDYEDNRYNSYYGVYYKNCGLRNIHMSWGHDEYLYHIMKSYLPGPALYIIRYHSFYAQHRENGYDHLMDEHDHKMFKWVKAFNPYDLYTKWQTLPDVKKLKPYYEDLIARFLPDELSF